jgi:hypothetical protein
LFCFVKPIQANPVPSILSRFLTLDVLPPPLPNGEGLGIGHRAVRQPGPIEVPASEAWNEITDKAGHPLSALANCHPELWTDSSKILFFYYFHGSKIMLPPINNARSFYENAHAGLIF